MIEPPTQAQRFVHLPRDSEAGFSEIGGIDDFDQIDQKTHQIEGFAEQTLGAARETAMQCSGRVLSCRP